VKFFFDDLGPQEKEKDDYLLVININEVSSSKEKEIIEKVNQEFAVI
jgi:heme oxygenase